MPRRRSRDTLLTPDADWFKARLSFCGLTQRQLATAIGIDASSVNRSLQGLRRFSLEEFALLADALRVGPGDLLRALGYEVAETGAPIVGSVRADGAVTHITAHAGKTFVTSPCPPAARALVIDAAPPHSGYDGAVVVYDEAPPGPPVAAAYGRLCVVEAIGQSLPILGVLSRPSGRTGVASIRPFGGGDPIEARQIVRASIVTAIHLRESAT